jgi:hypothetical protein
MNSSATASLPNIAVATPGNWFAVPLPSTVDDDAIADLVRQRAGAFPGLGEDELRRSIRAGAQASRAIGAIFAAMMLEILGDHALIATLVLTVTDTLGWAEATTDPDEIARQLSRHVEGDCDISTVGLPAGLAVRIWRLQSIGDGEAAPASLNVEFYIPVPGSSRIAALVFFSPAVELAEALTRHFDVIATTFRFEH